MQYQKAGVDREASLQDGNASRLLALSQPHWQQCIARDGFVPRSKDTADRRGTTTPVNKGMKAAIEPTEASSAWAKNMQPSGLPRSSTPLAKTEPPVVTPTKPIAGELTSPQTEEIRRETMVTSLESLSSSPLTLEASSPEVISLVDLVVEAVRVIHRQHVPECSPCGSPFESSTDVRRRQQPRGS